MPKRVLIVGGGVIGLSTAYYCIRKGHSVTVVDRNSPERDGCSFGNAGMIVPSHFVPLAAPGMVALGLKWMWNPESPFWIKPRLSWDLLSWATKFWRASSREHVARSAPLLRDLNLASRGCYEELVESSGLDFGLVKRGLLVLCKTEHALEEEIKLAGEARKLGMPAEVLDPRALASFDPGVQLDVLGGIHYPKDCHLSPDRLMAELKRELERLGAEFVWNAEALGWSTRAGVIEAVRTSRGDFPTDEVVLASGAWSPATARDLGLKLPMQAGKGYSLTLPSPRQLPKTCALLVEARVAVTPMGSSLRFGGTMEIAGLNDEINLARVRGISRAATRYFPALLESDFASVKPWRGLRPCTPDGLPYLGRPGRISNLVVATGHAMMGLSLGPITGKLASELVSGEPPSIDIALLSPDRYR